MSLGGAGKLSIKYVRWAVLGRRDQHSPSAKDNKQFQSNVGDGSQMVQIWYPKCGAVCHDYNVPVPTVRLMTGWFDEHESEVEYLS